MAKIPTFPTFCRNHENTVPEIERIEREIINKITSNPEKPTLEQLELGLAASFHTDHIREFNILATYIRLHYNIEIRRNRDKYIARGEEILGGIVEEELTKKYNQQYSKKPNSSQP